MRHQSANSRLQEIATKPTAATQLPDKLQRYSEAFEKRSFNGILLLERSAIS